MDGEDDEDQYENEMEEFENYTEQEESEEHPPPPNADSQNLKLDTYVTLAMYATLANQTVDHEIRVTTTYDLSMRIHDYFLANRGARYMMFNRQYPNVKQGELSVDKYARCMKLLKVGLANFDHAATEVDLTTQFLHGLDQHVDTIHVVLGDIVPLPPFDTVFSRVKLAKENIA
ncbi:uncharacterized protein [Aegilops tauschii subsp. strangulata]|uniref:uncharacterized protein n=1 Tax=Aegilops tauschii subsp. strangulata TaxID=200361 RepID=UPI003CC8633E